MQLLNEYLLPGIARWGGSVHIENVHWNLLPACKLTFILIDLINIPMLGIDLFVHIGDVLDNLPNTSGDCYQVSLKQPEPTALLALLSTVGRLNDIHPQQKQKFAIFLFICLAEIEPELFIYLSLKTRH